MSVLNPRQEKKETAEFNLVTGENRETKNSVFYRFIKKLKVENKLGQITRCRVVDCLPESEDAYFIFAFPVAQKTQLPAKALFEDQGYVLIDEHLTLGKRYTRKMTGDNPEGINFTSAAHCSWVYHNSVSNTYRIVHYYFDRNAQFSGMRATEQTWSEAVNSSGDVQIADQNKENKSRQKVLDLLPAEKEKIKINSLESQNLLKDIIKKQIENYQKALERTNKLERNLKKLSRDPNNRERYLEVAKVFIKAVKILNLHFSEYEDRRARVLKRNLEVINSARPSNLVTSSLPTQAAPVKVKGAEVLTSTSAPAPASRESPRSAPSLKKVNLAIAELKKWHDKLKTVSHPEDVEQTLLKHEILQEIQGILLSFELNPDLLLDPKKNKKEIKYIEELKMDIDKVPTLLSLFEREAFTGNLENVERLFPYVEHSLSANFFLSFFNHYAQLKDDISLQKMAAVCNFLHENSILYRSYICVESTFLHDTKENLNLSISLLVYYAMNMSVIKTLVSHGFNPNCQGLKIFTQDRTYVFPVIVLICARVKGADRLQLVEFLLHYGVDLTVTSESCVRESEKTYALQAELDSHLRSKTPSPVNVREVTDKTSSYAQFIGIETCLEAAALYYAEPQIIALLIPHFAFEQKLLALWYAISSYSVITYSDKYGMQATSSEEYESEKQKLKDKASNKAAFYSAIVFVSTSATKLLWNNLQTEYRTLSDKESFLKTLYEKWLPKAKDSRLSRLAREHYCLASIAVLILIEQELILQEGHPSYETNIQKLMMSKARLMESLELYTLIKVDNKESFFKCIIEMGGSTKAPFSGLKQLPVYKRAQAALSQPTADVQAFLPSQPLPKASLGTSLNTNAGVPQQIQSTIGELKKPG